MQALENLGRQTYPIDRVIVVDNGSTDDSAAVAARAGAQVITLASNAGFAAAVNRGVREADTEWIGILNNDVTLAPDWLERLMADAGIGRRMVCDRQVAGRAGRQNELTARSMRCAGAPAPCDAGMDAWIRPCGTSAEPYS